MLAAALLVSSLAASPMVAAIQAPTSAAVCRRNLPKDTEIECIVDMDYQIKAAAGVIAAVNKQRTAPPANPPAIQIGIKKGPGARTVWLGDACRYFATVAADADQATCTQGFNQRAGAARAARGQAYKAVAQAAKQCTIAAQKGLVKETEEAFAELKAARAKL